MKAVLWKGGKWMIDLEFSPWSPKRHGLRTRGDEGDLVLFDTEADAQARIAELEAQGEQGRIFKHDPNKIAQAVALDMAERKERKRGK